MKKTLRSLKSRITGFSTPIGGVSWEPPPDEATAFRRLVIFLEDCRVLYAPDEAEVPWHCIESVIHIRHHLNDAISAAPAQSVLETGARQMRAACRAFLDTASADSDVVRFGFAEGHWASWRFLPALGEFRARVGIQLAVLAAAYAVDIEDQLSVILPPELEDGE